MKILGYVAPRINARGSFLIIEKKAQVREHEDYYTTLLLTSPTDRKINEPTPSPCGVCQS